VPVRYISAWNEPNSGLFLAPQRASCATDSPSLAAGEYAPLVRALRAALDAAPGDQEVVVGDASSPFAPHPQISTVAELVGALPPDVVCAGPIWAQHEYAGDADGVAAAERALAARPACPGGARPGTRMWVTETGAGAATPGDPRPADPSTRAPARRPDPAALRAGCRSLAGLLERWYRDPRVEAAFQYTLRDDPRFPVGLAGPAGVPAFPTYALWQAWGARGQPTDPPPALPATCR
jgi:hypothetical protein